MELCTKILFLTTVITTIMMKFDVMAQQQYIHGNNILDIETPNFFAISPSPLRNRDNLRQQQYFSFLNTLYRHDRSKSNLFENPPNNFPSQNLHKQRRSIVEENLPNISPLAKKTLIDGQNNRQKRAVVFRPLFVYRQQEIKKQRLAEERRRRRIYRH